jgi:hypothetical protein
MIDMFAAAMMEVIMQPGVAIYTLVWAIPLFTIAFERQARSFWTHCSAPGGSDEFHNSDDPNASGPGFRFLLAGNF